MTDPVDELARWERSGGHWRVVGRAAGRVTVVLETCDGGTEMGRVSGPAGDLEAFLAGRTTSDQT